MNTLVLLFFAQNVIASALLGGMFVAKRDTVLRSFGIALLLDAAAFLIWSVAVVTRPSNLEDYVSIGTAVFIVSLVFLCRAGTQQFSQGMQRILMVVAAVIGAGIFYLGGLAANPSTPGFSADGFFFFNVHPFLQALYVFAFVLVAFPAIEALASRFTGAYRELIRYGFAVQVAGGVLLITAESVFSNAQALYFIGWTIGIVYFVLWATLLFRRSAWSNA